MQIRIVRLSEDIEREVEVQIGGHALTCFLSVCPYAISVGNTYEGSVSLWGADGLDLQEAKGESPRITRLGDGFQYRVVGVLRGTVLDAGIPFEDEGFSKDYDYLDGRIVAVIVDRIHLVLG